MKASVSIGRRMMRAISSEMNVVVVMMIPVMMREITRKENLAIVYPMTLMGCVLTMLSDAPNADEKFLFPRTIDGVRNWNIIKRVT